MVVTTANGFSRVYPKKDRAKALEDAAKYTSDSLNRTAVIEERITTHTTWAAIE